MVLTVAFLFRSKEKIKRIFYKKKQTALFVDTTDATSRQIYYSLDTFFTNKNLQNGFSGSVLISLRGKPVYEKCFGYCDYRTKNLLTDTNPFQLASVTKTFTATAILWCAEHHLLSLDDSLQKYFPKLPYKNIRIKDLLSHRSGLPNYLYFCQKECKNQTYLTNDIVIDYMLANRPAINSKANSKFEYCNTNYLFLASIIEQVSGKQFKAFMRETFFDPLQMSNTFIYDYADSLDKQIAVSYNSKWEIQYDDCFDGVTGDKGCYSTVLDMFKWDKAFYEGKLLSQEMMKEAYTPRSFEKPGARNYGYGWRLTQQPDSTYLVYHNGWWHGNNTVFYRNIQDTAAVIILSNKFSKSVYQIRPVWDILYGRKRDSTAIGEE